MKIQPLILTINGGSSSIKFALFEAPRDTQNKPQSLFRGGIDRIGLSGSLFHLEGNHPEENFSHSIPIANATAAIDLLVSWIKNNKKCDHVTAIAHRVVHGGTRFYQPEKVTAEMLQELRHLSLFDQDHLPMEILLIEALQQCFPKLPQVACFDTAFHHDLPRVAQLLPIPRCYEAKGVRRYGFHGLSCSFLLEELNRIGEPKESKIILAHLGSGASLTAVHHKKSIDTSMGFSPTSGIMMGTRSGDLDPELISFLAETEQMTTGQFQEMVNKKSGLLGISETSSDLRDLLACEKKDVRAAEAIALFCYQIKKNIGSFAAALGGLDTLVFSGGIGEHNSVIRQRICEGLTFLGIKLDEEQNQKNAFLISPKEATAKVCVIATDEELMLAKSTLDFL